MDREQAFAYAKQLSVLGDRVIGISEVLPKSQPKTVGEAKEHLAALQIAITGYSACLKELQSMTVPDEVKSEHMALTNVFAQYIEGCEKTRESIRIRPGATSVHAADVDVAQFLDGMGEQNNAASQTVVITNQISAVFQKHLA